MKRFTIALLVAIVGTVGHHMAMAQTMNSYTAYPPFINKSVPPAVMLMMTKDHRLFFKATMTSSIWTTARREAMRRSIPPTKTTSTTSATSTRRSVTTLPPRTARRVLVTQDGLIPPSPGRGPMGTIARPSGVVTF